MSWGEAAKKGMPLSKEDLQGNEDLYKKKIKESPVRFPPGTPTPPPMNDDSKLGFSETEEWKKSWKEFNKKALEHKKFFEQLEAEEAIKKKILDEYFKNKPAAPGSKSRYPAGE